MVAGFWGDDSMSDIQGDEASTKEDLSQPR